MAVITLISFWGCICLMCPQQISALLPKAYQYSLKNLWEQHPYPFGTICRYEIRFYILVSTIISHISMNSCFLPMASLKPTSFKLDKFFNCSTYCKSPLASLKVECPRRREYIRMWRHSSNFSYYLIILGCGKYNYRVRVLPLVKFLFNHFHLLPIRLFF